MELEHDNMVRMSDIYGCIMIIGTCLVEGLSASSCQSLK